MFRVISMISLVLLALCNNLILSCAVDTLTISKSDKIQQLAPETKMQLINQLENPLPFADTSKENYTLVAEVGRYNLQKIYKTKNPELLLSLYIPILPIQHCVKKDAYYFDIVNAYDYNSFFTGSFITTHIWLDKNNRNQQHPQSTIEKKISLLEEKRLNQFIDHKKNKYNYVRHGNSNRNIGLTANNSLCLAALFGTQEDISKELNTFATDLVTGNTILTALQACISNPDITDDNDNNAIKILFSDPRIFTAFCHTPKEERLHLKGAKYFNLLHLAQHNNNKKALNILITQDIHDAKNVIWGDGLYEPTQSVTALDKMIESGDFDQESIKLMRQYDGKTSQELQGWCTIS